MKDKFLRRHFGFTLPELIIAITVLGVMAGAVTLSSVVGKQTAKAEAEKIAAEIQKLLKTADRTHEGFCLETQDKILCYKWDSLPNRRSNWKKIPKELNDDANKIQNYKFNLKVVTGTTFQYNAYKNSFNGEGGSIEITRKDDKNDKYYIIFAETSGRVRASPNN